MRIKFYSDGPLLFFYDEAYRNELKNLALDLVIQGYSEQDKKSRSLIKLATEGKLLIYELFQDDEIDFQLIYPGPPKKEILSKIKRSWDEPIEGFLDVPSGKLCIESYSTLRINPHEDPEETGAHIDCTPGKYILSIHRPDNIETGTDLVILTPQKGEKPDPNAILVEKTNLHPPWAESCKAKRKKFEGAIKQVDDYYITNLNEESAKIMGLKAGMNMIVTVQGTLDEIGAVYIGEDLTEVTKIKSEIQRGLHKGFVDWEASWAEDSELGRVIIFTKLRDHIQYPENPEKPRQLFVELKKPKTKK